MTEERLGLAWDILDLASCHHCNDVRLEPALSHLAWTSHLYLSSFAFKDTEVA